jgi:hypothetical protein
LEATRSKLEATRSKLEATRSKLEATRSKLEATRSKLEATRSKLEATRSKLEATRSKLEATPFQLKATRSKHRSFRRRMGLCHLAHSPGAAGHPGALRRSFAFTAHSLRGRRPGHVSWRPRIDLAEAHAIVSASTDGGVGDRGSTDPAWGSRPTGIGRGRMDLAAAGFGGAVLPGAVLAEPG